MTLYETVFTYDADDDLWYARHPALPGCLSHGRTIDDASISLDDARREYLWSLAEDGLPLPPARVERGDGWAAYYYEWDNRKLAQ